MGGRFAPFLVAITLSAWTCAPAKPVDVRAGIDGTSRLATADGLLRLGCFDCLVDALHEYEAIRGLSNPRQATVDAATVGSIRAALLLELRARELGTSDEGHLQRARQTAEARDDLRQAFSSLIEAVEALPSHIVQFDSMRDAATRRRMQAFRDTLPMFLAERRKSADDDPLSAYAWIAFTCTYGDHEDRPPETLLAPLDQMGKAPLVAYRLATCFGADTASLEHLLRREPRFAEVNDWLGHHALGQLRLDEAEKLFARAYTWHARWPAVTGALANLYLAFEEPGRALDFHDQTLALVPGHPEAMIGRVKALSLLGRHDEAFDAIDFMLSGTVRILPGEAYYWRAWNDLQVGRLEEAWIDVEQANRLWVNSEVAKLGGIVAYRRRDLDSAHHRFEAARTLSPGDCETMYYLGVVHAEQREWTPTVDGLSAAAACIEKARLDLQEEIDSIRQSSTTAERKTRQIARREGQIATAGRMLATSWFNTAVACFNLSRFDEARVFAEKVADDEQFAERVHKLLKRLGPR